MFLRREALQCGFDDKAIARMLRAGIWRRVRHGCYCFADVWSTLSPEARHLVLARAVVRTTPGPVALSHVTALLAHGIAVWGTDLSVVHVTRLDKGAARREMDVVHHVGACSDADVVHIDGMAVVSAPRAVVEAATVQTLEEALVSADSALHRRRTDVAALHAMFGSMMHWPGSQKIHVVLHHMDGRAESPGETRCRFMFWRQGLPRPDLQFEVYDEAGKLVAITDFVWHEFKVFGEFDGMVKYGRLLRKGQQPGDVVFQEKVREDLVRRLTGYRCGRAIWTDLSRPAQTCEQFRSLLNWGGPTSVGSLPRT